MCTAITRCLRAFAGKSNESERQGSGRDADSNEGAAASHDEHEHAAENNERKC